MQCSFVLLGLLGELWCRVVLLLACMVSAGGASHGIPQCSLCHKRFGQEQMTSPSLLPALSLGDGFAAESAGFGRS